MRLTDTCTITDDGLQYGPPSWPCEFRHERGDVSLVGGGAEGHIRTLYSETATLIVGAVPELAARQSPTGLAVTHRGKGYTVETILPRYRTRGRLHHITLRLVTQVPQ